MLCRFYPEAGYPDLAMEHLCKRHVLADVSGAPGTLDIVFGEADR
jgi:NADH:ubiquinone oxidoreductase subunit D